MKTRPSQINRSGAKWLPGAMAVAAAGTAQAATVQITFANSYVSTVDGVHLAADFGNDGIADLVGFTSVMASIRGKAGVLSAYSQTYGARAKGGSAGSLVSASARIYWGVADTNFDGVGASASIPLGLSPILFKDNNILGGQVVSGFLEVSVFAATPGEKRVNVSRLLFNDPSVSGAETFDTGTTYSSYSLSAVPEPGLAGVCLLALGAGGLLERRRRKSA